MNRHTKDENDRQMYSQVKCAVQAHTISTSSERLQYEYFGVQVCQMAMARLWMCSCTRLKRMVNHAREGHSEMPQDLRSARHIRDGGASISVQATANLFWIWMYDNVAESLAEGDCLAESLAEEVWVLMSIDVYIYI